MTGFCLKREKFLFKNGVLLLKKKKEIIRTKKKIQVKIGKRLIKDRCVFLVKNDCINFFMKVARKTFF